jgi:D-threo-aldose 1-dehydrogenase
MIERAEAQGMGLINAAVHGSGFLIDPIRQDRYAYGPARPALMAAREKMIEITRRYGTDLQTAAIRFSTRDARFATTIVGMSNPKRVEATVVAATADLPDELFAELESVLPAAENWLDAGQ